VKVDAVTPPQGDIEHLRSMRQCPPSWLVERGDQQWDEWREPVLLVFSHLSIPVLLIEGDVPFSNLRDKRSFATP
jgi:hypothetical protein